MAEMTDQCAHAGCHCAARTGSDYCSDYCARDEDDFETGCLCDHPECQQKTAIGDYASRGAVIE